MSDKALVPVEQKTVLFYDDEITAVRLADGRVLVPVKPICDALGVAWSGQRQRINRDPVLSQVARGARVTRSPGAGGGTQEMLCLPLEFLNGWIFGISASRVNNEIRDRLVRYQMECYAVLYEAFQEGRLTAASPIDDLLNSDSDAAEAYRMAAAIMKLARHQLMLEATQQRHGRQLAMHGGELADHAMRLEELESMLAPGTAVTEDQASQVSQGVKAVAIALGKQTKRNEFGSVYGELYRKFGVTSYKLLPLDKFDEAMRWLSEWYQSLE